MKLFNRIIEFFKDNFTLFCLRIDRKYAQKLENTIGIKQMTEEELCKIIQIHDKVFPESFVVYKEYDFQDLLKQFCCFSSSQLNWKIIGNSYIIWSEHFNYIELNELAADKGAFGFGMASFLLKELKKTGNRKIHSCIRESTAYPLIKKLEKNKKLVILRDHKRYIGDEIIHDVIFRSC